MNTITIQYSFLLAKDKKEIFPLVLDAQNLELINNPPDDFPRWINLDFHQCSICPFNVSDTPHCPLALNMLDIVNRCDNILSYDEIHMEVITKERFISHTTTAQRGLSSLIGLVIATCGCPHTVFFKPMARFHLPLSSKEETIYRATSMYLLAQYFLKKENKRPDFQLKGLTKIYKNIELVNKAIITRLRTATESDSSINAIIILDAYAKTIPQVIEESLEDLAYLFAPYMKSRESN
ncbi:MAG: DUF6901 family protein [bacterium]